MRPPEGADYIPTSDPDILLFEVNDAHWYFSLSKEVWCKSVTAITGMYPKGEGFMRWLARQGSLENADQEKEAGGDRGTALHSGAVSLHSGETIRRTEFAPEVWTHLVSLVNWHERYKPETIAVENVVYDLRRRIAGTLDYACLIDGVPTVVDFKSSKYIYEPAKIQSDQYGHLWNSMGREPKIEQVGVVRTATKHKAGFEFWCEKLSDRRKKLFSCLHWIQHDFDPTMEPSFPEPLPDTLSLSDVAVNEDSEAVAVEGNGAERRK